MTASGHDAVLNEAVEWRGVMQLEPVTVDPAVNWPYIIVDVDGHTRRGYRTVPETVCV